MAAIRGGWLWISAAAVLGVAFIALLGPGISLSRPTAPIAHALLGRETR